MSAEAQLSQAVAAHQQAEKDVQQAALAVIRELVRTQALEARFFTMVDSDQGSGLALHRVFDEHGNDLNLDVFDEGVGSWLIENGYWQGDVVASTDPRCPERLRHLKDPLGPEFIFAVDTQA